MAQFWGDRKYPPNTLLIGKYGIKWEVPCGEKFGSIYKLTMQTSFDPRIPFLGMYCTDTLTHPCKNK